MSEICPNCGQATNSSFSRLIKDACGHMKCRMCLLYEEDGCESCRKQINNNDSDLECDNSSIKTKSNNEKSPSLENYVVVPLELVMKKIPEYLESDSKPPENNGKETKNSEFESNGTFGTKPENVAEQDYKTRIEEQSTLVAKKKRTYFDKSHISVIPGHPQKYQCNICKKIFQNKKCMHYHNACVTGIKPFQCTICNKSFVNRSHFEYHERMHTGYKPFKCGLCDKAFPQKNKLTRHMISHSNEKNFACPKCDKKYTKNADLKSHLYVHSDAKNNEYTCKLCSRAFGNMTHLKRHSRAHSNERPHVCPRCKKGFKDKSLLIRHCKTHEKERPFTCAHCSRGFLTKSELRRHLTIHSNEKPFSCTFCQTVFRRKDNLNRHIRHHHSKDKDAELPPPKTSNKVQKPVEKAKTKPKANKQKVKPKANNPKKNWCMHYANPTTNTTRNSSENQINSRLDPMGNITPVIKATRELSNAVPVINGPIMRRTNEAPKKTFTYMEPIPPAEVVDINKRIEAKLYPQSHNYFLQDPDYNEGFCVQQPASMMNSSLGSYSSTQGSTIIVNSNSPNGTTTYRNLTMSNRLTEREANVVNPPYNNCVSTIKMHSAQNDRFYK